jgi:hypothetical protein
VASFARLGSRDRSCPNFPPVATLSKAMLSASSAQLSRPSILSVAVACPCQITLYKRVSRSVWSSLNPPMVNDLLQKEWIPLACLNPLRAPSSSEVSGNSPRQIFKGFWETTYEKNDLHLGPGARADGHLRHRAEYQRDKQYRPEHTQHKFNSQQLGEQHFAQQPIQHDVQYRIG